MTREIIQVRLDIMQAYLDGQAIESRDMLDDDWSDDLDPVFDWLCYDYRIKPRPWRAEQGGTYYYVDADATIEAEADIRTRYDDDRYAIGNYFATADEAQSYLEEFKALFLKHKNA